MKHVLFLCIGNSCRSPMAEGFARAYGPDVMTAVSAGLSPALIVQTLTKQVMAARNVNIEGYRAKDLSQIDLPSVDLIVNLSGRDLPSSLPIEVRDWKVDDPIGRDEAAYLVARDQIEALVMNLILELRRPSRPLKRPPSLRSLFTRWKRTSRAIQKRRHPESDAAF